MREPDTQGAPPWREVRSRSARVSGDATEARLQDVAALADLVVAECQRIFASVPARVPEQPRLVACASGGSLREYLSKRGVPPPQAGEAASFHGPDGWTVAFACDAATWSATARIVRREVARCYLHTRLLSRAPEWLMQGLGELACDAPIVDGRLMLGSVTAGPVDLVRTSIEAGSSIGPERILSIDAAAWRENCRSGGGRLQAAQAMSMARFLLIVEGARQPASLHRFLQSLQDGRPQADAFMQGFGAGSEATFAAAWKEWALKARPSPEAESALRVEFLAEGVAVLAEADEQVLRASAGDGADQPLLFDGVLSRLAARGFRLSLATCGLERTIDASDPAFASASPASGCRFSMQKGTVDSSGRKREAALPAIATEGLGMRELHVQWKWMRGEALPKFAVISIRSRTEK